MKVNEDLKNPKDAGKYSVDVVNMKVDHSDSSKVKLTEADLITLLKAQISSLSEKIDAVAAHSTSSASSIFIKANNQLINLQFCDILYVEALGDYVNFFTEKDRFIVHKTMKGIEEKLPSAIFSRVHRSFVVNRSKIQAIEESLITIGKKLIPVGDVYREELMTKLNFL